MAKLQNVNKTIKYLKSKLKESTAQNDEETCEYISNAIQAMYVCKRLKEDYIPNIISGRADPTAIISVLDCFV